MRALINLNVSFLIELSLIKFFRNLRVTTVAYSNLKAIAREHICFSLIYYSNHIHDRILDNNKNTPTVYARLHSLSHWRKSEENNFNSFGTHVCKTREKILTYDVIFTQFTGCTKS